MNSLSVIFPCKYEGAWVFDDESRGLLHEPFVMGIDTMIEQLVVDISNAERGFKAVFSASNFPAKTQSFAYTKILNVLGTILGR